MEFEHKPVLLKQTLDCLEPDPDGVYVDMTVGGAGHSLAIAEKLSAKGLLVGVDQDDDALIAAKQRLTISKCEVRLIKGNFRDCRLLLNNQGIFEIDGAIFDIGVSSHQLDIPERGFSYMQNAPLDMRMSTDGGLTAEEVVNDWEKEEIRQIILRYGEEKWAARIAEFIVVARAKKRIKTTFELVDIIKAAIPAAARRNGPHPAKRTFQAIRIAVNDELGALQQGLASVLELLKPGGRLCVITFHSLEDRIVKEFFVEQAKSCTCPPKLPVCVCGGQAKVKIITRKPIVADNDELEANPRARSAKLRAAEKI